MTKRRAEPVSGVPAASWPHREVITRGPGRDPYLIRWTLLQTRWGKVMLHRFFRSDYEGALHDHPWRFVSIILAGGYWEVTSEDPHLKPWEWWPIRLAPNQARWFGPGRILRRPAQWRHRVAIEPGKGAWSLVFTGPKVREWGFWCPGGVGFRSAAAHAARTRRGADGCA